MVCLCPALAACSQAHLRLGPLPAFHSTTKGAAQQGNVPHRTVGLVICGARAHPAAFVAAGCATDHRISVSTAQAQCDQGSIRSQYACGYIVDTLALYVFELNRHNHVTHCKPSRPRRTAYQNLSDDDTPCMVAPNGSADTTCGRPGRSSACTDSDQADGSEQSLQQGVHRGYAVHATSCPFPAEQSRTQCGKEGSLPEKNKRKYFITACKEI